MLLKAGVFPCAILKSVSMKMMASKLAISCLIQATFGMTQTLKTIQKPGWKSVRMVNGALSQHGKNLSLSRSMSLLVGA